MSVYPELVALVGSRVPDYRGRFLRGLQSGHSVGELVENSIKSHNHTQPTHTHSFSGAACFYGPYRDGCRTVFLFGCKSGSQRLGCGSIYH